MSKINSIRPNIFLIGAMRCGSTTLHLMLDHHPDICMSLRKEPMFYFAEEMRRRIKKIEGQEKVALEKELALFVSKGRHREHQSYQELFSECCTSNNIGESSHYLYSPQVAETIFSDCPDARIIISLRNPVDRLYSEWLYYRRINARCDSFHEFMREGCEFNDKGELLSIGGGSRIGKGFYAQLVKPWLDRFGSEHVKIILFEDFKSNPKEIVFSIYKWLGVSLDADFVMMHAQQGGVPKRKNIFETINKSSLLKTVVKNVLPKLTRQLLREKFFTIFLDRPKISLGDEEFLKKIYSSDISELEALLGIALDDWK